MFPCVFRRGEVAQKTEVVGAASVDPNDRSKDAPTVTVLTKFAFDGSLLVVRRVVDNGVEVTCSLEVGLVDFQLSCLAHMTRDSADGVVV